jgi:hypothetical protein
VGNLCLPLLMPNKISECNFCIWVSTSICYPKQGAKQVVPNLPVSTPQTRICCKDK